jgi:hypothetical protein
MKTIEELRSIADALVGWAEQAEEFPPTLHFVTPDVSGVPEAKKTAVQIKHEVNALHESEQKGNRVSPDTLASLNQRLHTLAVTLKTIWTALAKDADDNYDLWDSYNPDDPQYEAGAGARETCSLADELQCDEHDTDPIGTPALPPTVTLSPKIAKAFRKYCERLQQEPDRVATVAILKLIESASWKDADQRFRKVENGCYVLPYVCNE